MEPWSGSYAIEISHDFGQDCLFEMLKNWGIKIRIMKEYENILFRFQQQDSSTSEIK